MKTQTQQTDADRELKALAKITTLLDLLSDEERKRVLWFLVHRIVGKDVDDKPKKR